MSRTLSASLAALTFVAATAALADENSVRQAFQSKFPNRQVESITKTPFPGLYELTVGGEIIYTDEKLNYIFIGNLLDARGPQPRSLTEQSMNRLMASTLAKSQDLAVKRVKGNGKRVIYTFEDPNCGYCKELQKEFTKINNVTIYTFLMPILSQDSVDKSRAVWCAKDRGRAWDDLMIKGVIPVNKRDCETPLERTEQLRQRFNLRGTPMVYLANGEQIGGFVPAEKIEAALNAVR
jgi:thiol:disulfide interchange protein DsbC